MAIVLDQNLGASHWVSGTQTTLTLTTSAAVAAGSRIIVPVAWFKSATETFSGISGGSLTWVTDASGVNGGDNVNICSADAPNGLASSTVLTATWSLATAGMYMGAISFTGVTGGASGYLDGTPSGANDAGPTTAWHSGNIVTAGSGLLVAVAEGDGTNSSSTPTSPSLEIWDQGVAGAFSTGTAAYRIEPTAGTYTIAGTWAASMSASSTCEFAVYKAAAVGGNVLKPSVPFMSNGRI